MLTRCTRTACYGENMRITTEQERVITALRQRFDLVPLELEFRIWHLIDPEDLESLHHDLRFCQRVEDVDQCVTWREGRQSGRVEGMKDAIFTVLGFDDDPLVDEIGDLTFETHDPVELEELLLRATDLRFRFSAN